MHFRFDTSMHYSIAVIYRAPSEQYSPTFNFYVLELENVCEPLTPHSKILLQKFEPKLQAAILMSSYSSYKFTP